MRSKGRFLGGGSARSALWIVALSLTLMAAGCTPDAGGLGVRDLTPYDPGPLQGEAPFVMTVTGIPVTPGQVVSIGVEVTFESAPDDLILERVDLLEPPDALRLDGAIASTGRGDSFVCVGASYEFPPPKCKAAPIESWNVSEEARDHRGFQVVLGLSITDEGNYGYPGIVLHYRDSDGDEYSDVFLQAGQLCSRDTPEQVGCPSTREIRRAQARLADELEDGSILIRGEAAASPSPIPE